MRLTIHLLGQPRIERTAGEPYVIRSRKSWALLAYLLLTERPPTRAQLATLLFSETDDPLRALRWNLSELRRALGPDAVIEGDPVTLALPPSAVVDLLVLHRGVWEDALRLPGLGAGLLEGLAVRDGAAFESWLLSRQRHVAAATTAIVHEAALGLLSRGRIEEAITQAVRLVELDPLDENNHALLIRLYRLAGDAEAARRQHAMCVALLDSELGVEPGAVVAAALRELPRRSTPVADPASVRAIVESGVAAVAAGASAAGVESLRAAVRLADAGPDESLRVRARLVLAEALIHALGGLDEEGLAALHEAHELALTAGDDDAAAQARAELGYVDFLHGRYDRAERWLRQAAAAASPSTRAKAVTYLGSVASDCARYPEATTLLTEAVQLADAVADRRREAYAAAMLGRVHLLRGAPDAAAVELERAIDLAQRDHWLAFLPWPQALLGEARLVAGDRDAATAILTEAFARACHIGDPCWEGVSARGLALLAAATGDATAAIGGLLDARERCGRVADPYAWLDAYILDALCGLGVEHGHPATEGWVADLLHVAAGSGMRELTVRALRHRAALGMPGADATAELLAQEIDNPRLHAVAMPS